jgi:cyclopropane-fatty-acyl-phospholipid synthase
LRAGRLEISGPGERCVFEGALAGPTAHVELRRWNVAAGLLHLNTSGASAYLDEDWDSSDLVALLTLADLNDDVIHARPRESVVLQARSWLVRRIGANVHARYRLDNEFYRRWLDPSLSYSAALFDRDLARPLEQAQIAKFERILHALQPRPGQTVLDIGCGWGGFAQYAAARYGCRVHGVTLSRRQVQWARERIEQAGLRQSVTIELRDFRTLARRYDHVVSIEAYEVAGEAAWGAHFDTIARCLVKDGNAFFQGGIIVDHPLERRRSRADFVRTHIHPTAQLAPWPVLEQHAQRAGLDVRASAIQGEDYAQTLKCWRERFNVAWPALARLGLERRFQRLWNFYLAHCEAGYRSGKTALVQAQLAHR